MSHDRYPTREALTAVNSIKSRFPGLWWPRYLFHYSDIENIVEILNCGHLYCRNQAIFHNKIKIDSASEQVIAVTKDNVLDFVRLYLRPRTPTLYRVEGFCPGGKCDNLLEAHCPMPIYLLFDSARVLSRPEMEFSDGNLASSLTRRFDSLNDFDKLPFDDIYHDTAILDEERKREIKRRRCAEVIIKNKIPLNGFLAAILCRSHAERETLIEILPQNMRQRYLNKIGVKNACFYCNRQYVKNVVLNKSLIDITYNMPTSSLYNYRYILQSDTSVIEKVYTATSKRQRFTISKPTDYYRFSISIDGHIAYSNEFFEMPF